MMVELLNLFTPGPASDAAKRIRAFPKRR
jgi:hypothetical protein